MSRHQLRNVSIAAIVILAISVVPMLWIGRYLHPFADDYVFGAKVYNVWNETHSFLACIQSAWSVAMNMYHHGRAPIQHVFLWLSSLGSSGTTGLGPSSFCSA